MLNARDVNLKILEMAQRIRELREIEGLTEQQMAEKTGIELSEYVACENGESDLPFAFIYRCALAFNVNVTDISDESGYIAALGKEAAAKAINDAKKSVAEQDREGSIGEANAKKEQRIEVSKADSLAIEGENEAKMKIAMSEAALKEKEAEALKIATTAEKIQAARALEESYAAERAAEEARRAKEQATLEADIIVRAEAKKKEMELEAEAEAEAPIAE